MRKISIFLLFLNIVFISIGNTCLAEHKEFVGKYGDSEIYVDTDSITENIITLRSGKKVNGFHCIGYFTYKGETRKSITSFANDGNIVLVGIQEAGTLMECKKGTGLYDMYQVCLKYIKNTNSSSASKPSINSSKKHQKTKPVYVTTSELKEWHATGKDYGRNNIYDIGVIR